MTANPIAGTLVFLLGGIAAATYLLPFRGVKGWAYETGWLVSVLAGWLVFPLVFDVVVVPDFWDVLGAAPSAIIFRSFGFGVLWGVGALCWALMVRYLGIGLGLGIGAGLCAATGTLLPPIFTGHAADLIATPSARMVLGGVVIALLGIVAVGVAGRLKEGEMSEEAKKSAVAEFNFKKGLVTAVIAGVASAGINFGLQGAPELEKAALAAGASPTWAGMPVLTIVLWGGLATQIAWSFVQHCKHRSFGDYILNPRPMNYMLSISVGVVGVMQFVLQKAGEPLMGDVRYISFAVLMSSAVFFSALLGVMLGEWKGTSARTKTLLTAGIIVLAAGFCTMAAGGR
jgi:L-rhamnose-H+ transport protein